MDIALPYTSGRKFISTRSLLALQPRNVPPFDVETELPHLVSRGPGLHVAANTWRIGSNAGVRWRDLGAGACGRSGSLIDPITLSIRLDPRQLWSRRERATLRPSLCSGRMQQAHSPGCSSRAVTPVMQTETTRGMSRSRSAKVVARALHQAELAAAGVAALRRCGGSSGTAEIGPGMESSASSRFCSETSATMWAAMLRRAPPDVDQDGSAARDRVLRVLDSDQGDCPGREVLEQGASRRSLSRCGAGRCLGIEHVRRARR